MKETVKYEEKKNIIYYFRILEGKKLNAHKYDKCIKIESEFLIHIINVL